MKNQFLLSIAMLFFLNFTVHAQLLHDYEFSNSYLDELGGNSMIPNGGSLSATEYLFGVTEGPNVSGVIDPETYSIELRFTPSDVLGWKKILDFKNLSSDNGLYIYYGTLQFYPYDPGPDVVFEAGVPVTVLFTRDGTTKEMNGYVNGVLQWTIIDDNDWATFTGPDNIIQILRDDVETGSGEATSGSLDYFKISGLCAGTDSDCDGVSDNCDVCPGGNDNGPCNATTLPPLSELPSEFLCSNNSNSDKIKVCHDGTTLCVSVNAANTHLAHGDFLGPCSVCSESLVMPDRDNSLDAQNGVEPELSFNELEVYPNPASDVLHIQLPELQTSTILTIQDQFGRTMWSKKLEAGVKYVTINLDQKYSDQGIYYINGIMNGEMQAKRIVISR